MEPSGAPFNAISFDEKDRPVNPLINVGAVTATSLIGASDADERFEKIRAGLSLFAGRELEIDETVYRSESSTGDRNRALATLSRANGKLASTVDAAAEPHFKQCSLLVTSTDLAVMGATLANSGVNPLTDCRVVEPWTARHTLSVMSSCGMYDRSGQWIFEVGMPAKSGVGGGIVAVMPGQYGIGVFSPPLDEVGNSARGVAALRLLSERFGLHMFEHPKHPASPVEQVSVETNGTVAVRLRGSIDFVGAEIVVHDSIAALSSAGSHTLVLDFSNATTVSPVAVRLLNDLTANADPAGYMVTHIDPNGHLGPPTR